MLRGAVIAVTAIAGIAGCADPVDGGFCAELDADTCAAVGALRLGALPPSPGNAHADDPTAAALGQTIFFGSGFANGGDVRCASCHLPELAFHDAGPVSTGLGRGVRNAPTTLHAARLTTWFWDGRADSLWSQPLFAFENPLEMNFTRLELAHRIDGDAALRAQYVAVFGDGAALDRIAALPARGKPGDPAWEALPADDQRAVDRIAADTGKALEAYLRRATIGDAPIDAYLDGDDAAISPLAARGLQVFAGTCLRCHSGPMLTDARFHGAGFPSLPGAAPDRGRADGAAILVDSIFNSAGPFADVPAPVSVPDAELVGAFRTPSLRDIAATAPYGHDGALTTLPAVLDVHAPELTADDRDALLAFLLALSGARPPRPWGDWPHPQ